MKKFKILPKGGPALVLTAARFTLFSDVVPVFRFFDEKDKIIAEVVVAETILVGEDSAFPPPV